MIAQTYNRDIPLEVMDFKDQAKGRNTIKESNIQKIKDRGKESNMSRSS